jgi:hypothetical protein
MSVIFVIAAGLLVGDRVGEKKERKEPPYRQYLNTKYIGHVPFVD